MKNIDAYVFFENECREAMNFYQQCLGGELTMMTIGESPAAEQMPADKRGMIMHSSLTNGTMTLLAADNCMGAPPQQRQAHGPVAQLQQCRRAPQRIQQASRRR